MPGWGTRRLSDGSLRIRPRGALVLCVAVWALCGALVIQAVAVAGVAALVLAPGPVFVAVTVWALLWEPRVIVSSEGLEVRNPVRRHTIPFPCVENIRLGAMLRVVVRDGEEGLRVLTAWNAPGVGRDRPRDRLSRIGDRTRSEGPRMDWAARLREDQRSSPSSAVVEAWERWKSGHGDARPAATEDTVRSTTAVGPLVAVIATVVVLVASVTI